MEWKSSNRSSQSQTKSQTNDPKKSQDTSLNKPWPRSNKKREYSNNTTSKNDTNRRPPIKSKSNFDKRPRPRGTGERNTAGTTRARVNDDIVEVGSVFLPGSKKQNLNHLLNFQYAPRGGAGGSARQPNWRRFHGLVYTNTHKHNNDLFLQSNCQFVVKADGDFKAHLSDPDIPVNWDLVEQINVRVSEPLTCPICLTELVAGQITRCGHAYCWPCLLHYFSLSEDSYRPCPICFQPIDKSKLKSVQGVWQENTQHSGDICMRLMRRAQGSTVVEPVPEYLDQNLNSPLGGFLSVSHADTTLFAKLLIANMKEVASIINRERQELSNSLLSEADSPEYCFIQQALNLLQIRESKRTSIVSEEKSISVDTTDTPPPISGFSPVFVSSSETGGLDFVSDFNNINLDDLGSPNNNPLPPGGAETSNTLDTINNDTPCVVLTEDLPRESQTENDPYNFFYFYQASDGQAVFLEGLEVRMLQMSWNSLKYAPRSLKGRVLRRTSGSVSDEARKRLKCLRHLPIHCPYDMVQIELKPPSVSQETLKAFKSELEERKRQSQRRVREEKRLERVVSRQEQKLLGQTRGLQLHLDSDVHFPAYQPDPIDTLNSQHFPVRAGEEDNEGEDTPRSSISESSANNLSFAKMASTSGTWKMRVPEIITSPPAVTRQRCDSETSETLESAPPSYNVSLSEAISAALSNAQTKSDQETAHGKKKKKNKAKVLFTTGIQHHNSSN